MAMRFVKAAAKKSGPPDDGALSTEKKTLNDSDDRLDAPSARRNTAPIIAALAAYVPETGRALEIASGSGLHVVACAAAFPGVHWQPSDAEARARASIAAWIAESGRDNIAPPLTIDVTEPGWQAALAPGFDLVLCINMVHISPWSAAEGLMQGTARLLRPGGVLFVYSCFMRDGRHFADSNARFDETLRRRNPDWGVRDAAAVFACGAAHGLEREELIEMPANNLALVLRRSQA
jgi:SAM-dependent methyltransferase